MKLNFSECLVLGLIMLTTCSTYMLHVDYPGHDDAPKKRFKRGVVNPPLPPLDAPTTPPPLASPPVKKKPSLLLRNKQDLRPSTSQDEKPSVAVAVPTHNRIGYVQLTSKALRGTIPANDVWVFDDQSDEYKHKDLASWYGTEHIFIAKRRLKADAMARHILEWFVSSQYDVLVLLDSDLVVAPNWLDSLHDGLRDSKGLLSLYRSGAPKHRSLRCGGVLCEQPSMGNAGTVWRRSIAEKMLSEMPNRDGGFDWGWSEWCVKNKIPMETLLQSAVLHIGMYGSWSHESSAEKSVGFPMQTLSVDVRQRAEHFLKGAKPTVIAPSEPTNKKLLNPNHDDKSGDIYKDASKPNKIVIPIVQSVSSEGQPIHINGGKKRIACDVPCFWSNSGGIIKTIKIDELDTTITMSMEGEQYYPSLKLSNRRKKHLIASTRFDSDIPMPYYHWPWTLYTDKTPMGDDTWSKNYIQTPHIPFLKVKKAAVFIARNCGSKSNREDLVTSLMKLMPVDSVSSCLHNFDLRDTSKKGPMMQKYAMYFAFENQRIDDYITEKLWDTFRAGVLPVYFGAPNIRDHVPEHSIVNVDDFTSREELAKHLNDILNDEELYNSYHAWRYKPLPEWFIRKYNFTHVHSACRVCRWASAKLRGLSWDAEQQQISYISPSTSVSATSATFVSNIGLTLYRLGSYNLKTINVVGSGLINILTRQHYGLFQYKNEGEISFHFENGDSPLWMTVNGNAKIVKTVKMRNIVRVEWPKRTLKYLTRTSDLGQITLCTQLTIERLERLVHLSKTWLGPISAAIYVGYRTQAADDILKIRSAWFGESNMQTWVDIHLVYAKGKSWFSFTDIKNPYPVNLMRQISVENTNTAFVLYIEADIQVQDNAHEKIMAINRDGYSEKSAFVLPLFSSSTVPTQVQSYSNFKPIGYQSHQGLAYSKWKQTSDIMTYRGKTSIPGEPSKINNQEPYFVVRKSVMPAYDVLYWSMIGDKVQHINDMSDFDFYVLPGCFLVDTPSVGMGAPWLTKSSSYRKFVSSMHLVTISERAAKKSSVITPEHNRLPEKPDNRKNTNSITPKDILWVIPAFKRAWSLDLVLKSLASQSKILVSKDADSDEIDAVLGKYSADVISHPWSCSRHPNQFPAKDESLNENYKGDSYGNPRSPWATCLKHHWWWMMKQAWARNPERVCVLEDDTVIHPQAFEWLARQSDNVKLTPEQIAVPWCMSAKEWQAIDSKTFCEHDDYNWDQTIAWMKEHGHGPNEAVVPSVSLSMHVGDCGGWDAGGRDKACTSEQIVKIRANVQHWLGKPVAVNTIKKKWLTAHSKPNGGWGHPKDWAHCMGNDNSPKYVVVIPSVKRNNDEYLRKTLDSLEKAKPADVSVLLINANQPAEEHIYLRDWCSSHEKYKCINPPKVPESLIRDVISNDKRGDTEHFLRWRTTETEHALFGLREALKLNTEYIIWMQDDVIVNKDLFASLVNDDIMCLRDGKDYCGAVAYLFSRKFVSELIPKIEANKLTMPIDWIIFDPRPPEAKHQVPKRIPLAHHIGKVSTKHHLNALSVHEKHHDEYSLSEHHRLKRFKHGPELTGDALKRVLLNVLKHVSEVMQSCNTEYIVWAGTLLGALRHHGFIPWDNDVDILIKASSEKSLLNCIETRDEMPFTWIIRHGKHSDIIPIKVVDKNSGYYVDIFMCWEQADGTCEWRFSAPINYYPLKDLFPSKPCMFDNLVVTCPSKPRAVLERTYKSLDVPATYAPVPTFSDVKWATTKIIQTSDLFAAIDYNAPENTGPWKQGWEYDYDGRFKDGLTVHVVPHSHNDPGWIKTYHTYYSTQTKHILDTVVAALVEDPRRTFIWAEISYFSLWWNDASPQQKEQAKRLVAEKRLDFVTGGWVMNDEASVTARATRWHLQEGREWLQNTFGVTPQYSWAIDPFGHSAGQAQVLKELGYKGMLIQRVHYAVKKQLAQKQQLEFQWQTPAGDIFTHMMPFYSYDGPHTCGPDPSICCQFDFARIGKGKTWTGCPWGKMAVEITEQNVAERSRTWLDQVYKKAMLYRGKNVFVPVGDDFRYQSMDEAHKQYRNYQKMFDWIEKNIPSVKASFSTLTKYFDAQRQTEVPSLQGSFFPYSDREKDYWTGYFNSRIFYKGYDRLLESLIAAVERKCPSENIHSEKRALGLFQHHDGITGTAKSAVVQDYYQTMQKAVESLRSKLKGCLSITESVLMNPLSIDTPTMKADDIRPLEEDVCVNKRIDFEKVRFDEHGILIEIDHTPVHETLVWRSNTAGPGVAGAYLMSVTSVRDVLVSTSHSTCSTKYYKQMETVFDLVTRRVRVYNDGTLEIMYSVDIHARNNGELWAVYKPEWTAERLCSDVHGLTWECHTERKDAPLQAKFWPMPTMAWLASSSERLTFTGAQPTGVGFHEGALVLMLDRRGDQDDARGLGQGITDSRPVDMRFGVLVETESLKEKASEKALSIRNWMLNPEIKLV